MNELKEITSTIDFPACEELYERFRNNTVDGLKEFEISKEEIRNVVDGLDMFGSVHCRFFDVSKSFDRALNKNIYSIKGKKISIGDARDLCKTSKGGTINMVELYKEYNDTFRMCAKRICNALRISFKEDKCSSNIDVVDLNYIMSEQWCSLS
jgi:hypothetical protein